MEILTKKNLYRVVCTYGYKSSTYVKRKKIKTALQQILKLLIETCLHFFIQALWGILAARFNLLRTVLWQPGQQICKGLLIILSRPKLVNFRSSPKKLESTTLSPTWRLLKILAHFTLFIFALFCCCCCFFLGGWGGGGGGGGE